MCSIRRPASGPGPVPPRGPTRSAPRRPPPPRPAPTPGARACGNPVTLKPSERDPRAGFRIAELRLEAGLRRGVFKVVKGDKGAVAGLLAHPDVAAVSFVGSTAIASHIYATAAQAGKRGQALGGAKNHMVGMPDAELGPATHALVGAAHGPGREASLAGRV